MKRFKIMLLVAGLLLIFGSIAVWVIWNKPHRKAEGEQGITMSADSLIAVYNADEHAADTKYLNKTLQVRGVIAKTDTNSDGQTTVLFASADPLSSVFCTMRDKGDKVDSGRVAVIKGFCSGHTSDVLLTDCIIVK
jgi:hypothetical protein